VVELQYERISLPTVDAWMRSEEVDELRGPLRHQRALASLRFVDVPLPMQRIVLLLVRGPARTAVVVSLASRPSTPREVFERLAVPTPTADPVHS
jgi:hypothetical protein